MTLCFSGAETAGLGFGQAHTAPRAFTASRALQAKNPPVGLRFRRVVKTFCAGAVLMLSAAVPTLANGDFPANFVSPPVAVVDRGSISGDPAEPDVIAEADPNEVLEFGAMRVQRWIVETILKAADAADVDPVYMMALADKESSFIPANKASTSSAEGLFQFISSTWLQMVRTYGAKHGLEKEAAAIQRGKGGFSVSDSEMKEHILNLRRDPYLSSLMAAEMMKRDRKLIEQRIGREISRSEFYLAHFLGANSAGKLMALVDGKPTESASRAFPAAAKANKSLFYAKDGRKTRHLSVAEVYERIDGMMDKRLVRYEQVKQIVTADASF
jgi:hypothetical protein